MNTGLEKTFPAKFRKYQDLPTGVKVKIRFPLSRKDFVLINSLGYAENPRRTVSSNDPGTNQIESNGSSIGKRQSSCPQARLMATVI